MDADRKKELRAAYKESRPEMGVISVTCSEAGEVFLAAAVNIPAAFNKMQFQLSSGLCPNKQLQELWDRLGEGAFEFGVVQYLEPSDSEDDCADDLEDLLELCLTENPEAKRWSKAPVKR